MSDLALIWNEASFGADLSLVGPVLATDDGLVTAVIISLFSDRRARADDALPQAGADRRGWWGDTLAADGRETGSRLWLYARSKALVSVLEDVRDAAREALAWLTEDGIASAVDVITERQRRGATDILALGVTIHRPDGPMRLRFDAVWGATAASLSGKPINGVSS